MNQTFSEQLKDELDVLWRFAMRLTHDRALAEDLVQKTILRSLEKRHQFAEGSKLRSWLFKILHSIWKNDLREIAIRSKVNFSSVDLDKVESTNNTAEENIFFKQVMQQINNLPEAQRTAMILVCIDGYSYKETAEILEIPTGTVMSRIARARLKIGQIFNKGEQSKKDMQHKLGEKRG